eukprot:357937-Chlamydomonas_euryale.AAC.9
MGGTVGQGGLALRSKQWEGIYLGVSRVNIVDIDLYFLTILSIVANPKYIIYIGGGPWSGAPNNGIDCGGLGAGLQTMGGSALACACWGWSREAAAGSLTPSASAWKADVSLIFLCFFVCEFGWAEGQKPKTSSINTHRRLIPLPYPHIRARAHTSRNRTQIPARARSSATVQHPATVANGHTLLPHRSHPAQNFHTLLPHCARARRRTSIPCFHTVRNPSPRPARAGAPVLRARPNPE